MFSEVVEEKYNIKSRVSKLETRLTTIKYGYLPQKGVTTAGKRVEGGFTFKIMRENSFLSHKNIVVGDKITVLASERCYNGRKKGFRRFYNQNYA